MIPYDGGWPKYVISDLIINLLVVMCFVGNVYIQELTHTHGHRDVSQKHRTWSHKPNVLHIV
jgi:hypothetical protein